MVITSFVAGGAIGALVMWAATRDESAPHPAPATSKAAPIGRLEVTSVPDECTVVVDGRLVGLTPIERIDLEPGKHAVVIDSFGYQPYAGTVTIVEEGAASLEAVLAAIGAEGTTSGRLSGKGTVSHAAVPSTALAPAAGPPAAAPGKQAAKKRKKSRRAHDEPAYREPARRYEPPPRPRRDCSGERSTCKNGCDSAKSSCRFDCPNCVSCPSSVGWENCKKQCESCRKVCEQNAKFCESSCKSSYDSCTASQ